MNDDKLNAALKQLPRDVQPERDLWPSIAGRIGRKPRTVRPLWSYGLAASLLVAVGAASLWSAFGVHQGAGTPAQTVAMGSNSAGNDYFAERAAYAENSVQSAANLAPETRAVILKNLRIIESSMQDIHSALDKDPNNPRLRALLFDLYQNEARLLAATQQADAKTTARNSL